MQISGASQKPLSPVELLAAFVNYACAAWRGALGGVGVCVCVMGGWGGGFVVTSEPTALQKPFVHFLVSRQRALEVASEPLALPDCFFARARNVFRPAALISPGRAAN